MTKREIINEYRKAKNLFKDLSPNNKITADNFTTFLKQLWSYKNKKLNLDKNNSLTALDTIAESGISTRLYNILLTSCPLFNKGYGSSMPILKLHNLSKKEFLRYNGEKTLKELQRLCRKVKVKMLP